jgi:large subunit ribosomal protein L17
MRHRVNKNFFNRDTKHRKAMLRGGLRNLFLHGEIKTTEAKAKEFKRLADKIMSKALKDSVVSRRQLHQFFGKRDVVNTLVDQIAPVLKSRKSGFTRIVKHGRRRGDNTEMVKLELVEKPQNLGTFKKHVEVEPVKKEKKTIAKKVTKKSPPKKESVKKAKSDGKKSQTKSKKTAKK